jgi:hypothetical protein
MAPFRQLRTPRAAALAGVLFALLFGAVIVLIRLEMPADMRGSASWIASNHPGITAATVLMPFAGISFLWFIGVVRDGFGRYEDRFFASVFFGSGLLFLAMMFVSTAIAAGLVATVSGVPDPAAQAGVVDFGRMVVLSTCQTYAVRMAAVFMSSAATIWLRTGLMPKWLALLTYLVAFAILGVSDVSMWVALAFPTWVLVISGLFLVRAGVIDVAGDERHASTVS